MKFKAFYDLEEFEYTKKTDNSILFTTVCDQCKGDMLFYEVMDGISIVYNELKTNQLPCQKKFFTPLFSINYCYDGRVECDMTKGKRVQLAANQILLSIQTATQEDFQIPSNYYKGVTISIDLEYLSDDTVNYLSKFDINLQNILNHLRNQQICILDCETTIQHLFNDLIQSPFKHNKAYLKIKILEVLYIISHLDLKNYLMTSNYIEHKKSKKMKEIAHYIVKHYNENLTVKFLCGHFQISESYLKKYFKFTFGVSVHTYIQKCRVDAACQWLVNSNKTILEIASLVGYKNPSKFSGVFKREKNCTPIQYRKMSNSEMEQIKRYGVE